MGMPTDIGVFDTLIGLPPADRRGWYQSFQTVLHDEGSKDFDHPAGYMYRNVPKVRRGSNTAEALLDEMDRFGVEFGLVPVTFDDPDTSPPCAITPTGSTGATWSIPTSGSRRSSTCSGRSRRSA